jgi:hypothetical protein
MKNRNHDRLRRAWYGPLSAQQIARQFGYSSAVAVQNFWTREKRAGRLPCDEVRPHFIKYASPAASPSLDLGALVDAAADPALMREIDRSERLSERGESLARVASDQSLAALRKAHPDLDHPAAHSVPNAWLKFDQRGAEPPSHARLMQMARDHDAMTRARRSNPAPRLETCA